MSAIWGYNLVVSSKQTKQGVLFYGKKSTVNEMENVPPITNGILSCKHRELTAASNLSPQSIQL